MAWYAWYSCGTGWFCPGSYALQDRINVKLKARTSNGEYEDIKVSHGISAVVLLNLQSYGGGRDLWGLGNDTEDRHTKKTFRTPIFNDGKFEVVGLRSGWHTALVMGKFSRRVHATRLAQTDSIIMTANAAGEHAAHTYLQLDGEPWPQRVPSATETALKMEVTFDSKSHMLFNTQYCLGSRSIRKLVARSAILSNLQAPEQDMPSFLAALLHTRKRGRHKRKGAAVSVEASGAVPEASVGSKTYNPYATRSQRERMHNKDATPGAAGGALEPVAEDATTAPS